MQVLGVQLNISSTWTLAGIRPQKCFSPTDGRSVCFCCAALRYPHRRTPPSPHRIRCWTSSPANCTSNSAQRKIAWHGTRFASRSVGSCTDYGRRRADAADAMPSDTGRHCWTAVSRVGTTMFPECLSSTKARGISPSTRIIIIMFCILCYGYNYNKNRPVQKSHKVSPVINTSRSYIDDDDVTKSRVLCVNVHIYR